MRFILEIDLKGESMSDNETHFSLGDILFELAEKISGKSWNTTKVFKGSKVVGNWQMIED